MFIGKALNPLDLLSNSEPRASTGGTVWAAACQKLSLVVEQTLNHFSLNIVLCFVYLVLKIIFTCVCTRWFILLLFLKNADNCSIMRRSYATSIEGEPIDSLWIKLLHKKLLKTYPPGRMRMLADQYQWMTGWKTSILRNWTCARSCLFSSVLMEREELIFCGLNYSEIMKFLNNILCFFPYNLRQAW